jgi:PPP family 3-phenylpropionic acid transporter
MSAALAASIRYAAFYGAMFLALGVYLPFWPVWLGSRGVTAEQIGVWFALASWIRVVSTPAIAQIADRVGRPRTVLAILAGTSALSFAAFYPTAGFWPILVVTVPALICIGALVPLGESETMAAVVRDGLDYGRVRLWGSLAFIVGTVGAGSLLRGRDPDFILALIVLAMFAALLAALALPRQPSVAVGGRRLRPTLLLADRRFILFLVATSLLQASHATYYAFSVLHWQAAGLSETLIGWLWAEGVIAEVAFFAVSTRVLARAGPLSLLVAAGLAGVIRWAVLGATAALPAIVVVQLLHAATFGAAHLGAMHFIARTAPPGLAATAQGVYAAATGGIGLGLALLLAGGLYGISPASAFLAMAALSAGGTALAVVLHRRERSTPGGTKPQT